jgi:hypothetical protein
LWLLAQPACNPNPALNPKYIVQLSLLEDDEYRRLSSSSTNEKTGLSLAVGMYERFIRHWVFF